jgi:hypothetical protein
MELLDLLNKGWFGVLFGLAVGWIFYRRSLRDPKISYQRKTTTLIDSVPGSLRDRVKVTYEGALISDLHVTRLLIWNSGTAAVQKGSFPEGDELTLKAAKIEGVLGVDVRKTSKASNRVHLTASELGYRIGVSYLNPGDAFVIDVLHRSEAAPFTLRGVLLGQSKGIVFDGAIDGDEITGRPHRSQLRMAFDMFLMLGFGSIAVVAGYSYLMRFINDEPYQGMTPYSQLLGAIFLSLVGIAGLLTAVLVILQKGSRKSPRIELID